MSQTVAHDVDARPWRVLGIDPGLNTTGYAVLERCIKYPRVCEAGVIRGTVRGSLTARVKQIFDGLTEVISTFSPAALALEELYSHYARPKTAILMGHARGVICLAAEQAGLPVASFSATQVKKTLTGSGRASKQQLQQAVQRELNLQATPDPFDVSDALAIALCGFYGAR